MEKDDDGQRIYNLYLRVTQEGGTGDSTKWINTTAFTIDKFLDQAKAIESREGQNEINFKINYAERYNADTTACVWGASPTYLRCVLRIKYILLLFKSKQRCIRRYLGG